MCRLFGSIAVFGIAMLVGCAKNDSSTSNTPSDKFTYTGKDSLGATVVRGWITIDVSDTAACAGAWQLDTVAGASSMKLGPQIGAGAWVGTLSGGVLHVVLNPSYADNNVDLWGAYTSDSCGGKWSYSTLHGLTNHGSFTAVRK